MSECKHDWKNENWLSINAKCELCGVVLSWKDINEQLRQQLQAAEQQNAQLQADCAEMRGALAAMLKRRVNCTESCLDCSIAFCDEYRAAEVALSTSSGKDMLELVDAVGELAEEAKNMPAPKYEATYCGKYIVSRGLLDKVIGAIAKVKGGA